MNQAEVVDSRPTAPSRSLWPKVVLAGLALVGGLVLVYAYLAQVADRRLQEAIAEADRLDPGWRLEDLEAMRARIPTDDNAATVVRVAKALLPPPAQWPDGQLDD